MKKFIILLVILSGCFSNIEATYPRGARLCNKNMDCFEGQYCGFMAGYTAAICLGAQINDRSNLYKK